jgi:hypothetical protein
MPTAQVRLDGQQLRPDGTKDCSGGLGVQGGVWV